MTSKETDAGDLDDDADDQDIEEDLDEDDDEDDPPADPIVAIALVLDERTGYTLWAPPWIEDGEEWQAFLGISGKILLFTNPVQLRHYIHGEAEHDLVDHPGWQDVLEQTAQQLIPDDDYVFDLDGIYELVGEGPDRWSVTELGDAVDIVARMGESCDAPKIDEHLSQVPELPLLELGHEVFLGRGGERAWTQIAEGIGAHWEPVLEELGKSLSWVQPLDLGAEESEFEAAAETVDVTVDDVIGGAGALGVTDEDTDPDESDAEFWESVGILPVRITVPAGTGITLRCYVDDAARFLGEDLNVEVFRTADGLSEHIEDGAEHDLTALSTWGAVVEADAVPVVSVEDSYDLVALTAVLTTSDDMWDLAPLVQAAEGVLDLAEYCRLERVNDLLGPATELGRALADAQRGIGRSLRPTADSAAMARQWQECVEEISSCLRWHD